MIVGGLASRVASEVLQARPAQLRLLTPHFVDYVLAFYGTDEPARGLPARSCPSPSRRPSTPKSAVSRQGPSALLSLEVPANRDFPQKYHVRILTTGY